MGVIPDVVNEALWDQYRPGSTLRNKYPEITRADWDNITNCIKADWPIVHQICVRGGSPDVDRPIYLATAGSPGAGKSIILEQVMQAHPAYADMVKTDPDIYAMRFMVNTIQDLLLSPGMVANAYENGHDYAYAQRRAYDIARAASNIFANRILNDSITARYNVAHGTTMTGRITPMPAIKEAGYKIHLLLCYAPDDVRVEAVRLRAEEQANYQVTPEDVRDKGLMFPQRFESYFGTADYLTLFWRDEATGSAVVAARFENGRKTVVNPEAYAAFAQQFEADRVQLSLNATNDKDIIVPPSLGELEAGHARRLTPPSPSPSSGPQPGP
jgi:hypothetical protein